MAEVKWIKIVPDVFDDDKIKLIETMPEGDSIIVIWFKLLCLAGKQNRDGFLLLNDKIAYTDEMLSTVFRRPLNTVRLALSTFEQFDMIEIINGAVYVTKWEKHQSVDKMAELREYNRLAQQKSRAKKKLLPPNNDVNDKSMTSQRCQGTDIDIDKDIEEDKEKRKKASTYDGILSSVENDDLRGLYLEYIKMRKMIKAPMTDRALTMLINKVNELEPNSIDNQKKLLEIAIMNNWKSVYPWRDKEKADTKQPSKQEEELLKMFGG